MREEDDYIYVCPNTGLIDVISKKWALFIITVVGACGKLRFGEIMEQLRFISPKTLSDTLKSLNDAGLVTRESFAEIPPRVEYALTEEGSEFRDMIIPIMRWASFKDCVDPENRIKIKIKKKS